MNAVKRQRSTISPDDTHRLLFHLEDARSYVVKYGAAQDFHSPNTEAIDQALKSIDVLAKQITGSSEYFWQVSASAAGNDATFKQASERALLRRRLMGIAIPVRAIKIPLVLTSVK
jgi:hypothetical protein